jgi:hypothetical protein
VDLAGGGPGTTEMVLPPMTSRNWPSWAATVTVWPAWIMPIWIIGCDRDATLTAHYKPYALIFIRHRTIALVRYFCSIIIIPTRISARSQERKDAA